jgi:outer membrane protein assembly factor BamB
MRSGSLRYVLLCGLASLAAPVQAEDNWPNWRGPLGTGVAADGDYPVEFSADKGVAWKTKLPGLGSSTPAVWGDSIFITCEIDEQDAVVCYDMEGQEKWREAFGAGRPGKHRNGSGANPSPVTDGEHLVTYYKSGCVACLDVNGKKLWQINLQDKYGKDTLWWDLGTSPVIAGENVVIAVMQAGDGYLVALDLGTGDVAWKQSRKYEIPESMEESDQAYTTPQVVELDGRTVLITFGADHLTMHDAATGEPLYDRDGFNPEKKGFQRVIASMTVENGLAIVPWGRAEFLSGIDLASGPTSEPLWTKQGLGCDVPTPAVRDGKAYVLADDGRVACLDMKTGKEHWADRLPKSKDKFYASPLLAGSRLYCVNEGGGLFVVDIADSFKLLHKKAIDMGESVIATPIAVRGKLIIRGTDHLFQIEGDAVKTASAGG